MRYDTPSQVQGMYRVAIKGKELLEDQKKGYSADSWKTTLLIRGRQHSVFREDEETPKNMDRIFFPILGILSLSVQHHFSTPAHLQLLHDECGAP